MSLPRAAAAVALVLSWGCRSAPSDADAVMQIVARAIPLRAASPNVALATGATADATTTLGAKTWSMGLEPLGLQPKTGVNAAGAVVFADAARDTDVVWLGNGDAAEELRVLRSPRASTSARYRLTLGGELAAVRVAGGDTIEAIDRGGAVLLASAPLYAVDARGVRRSVHAVVTSVGDHLELETSLDAEGLAYPIVVDPAWSAVAPMSAPRAEHTATTLNTGAVLVTGGTSGGARLSTVELFDPSTKTWSSTAAMSVPRSAHTATLLASGKVLVVGGTSNGSIALSSAELYDPVAKTWSPAAAMTLTRSSHSATLLPGEKVLVAGGTDLSPGGQTATAVIYDAATNTWSAAGTMASPRQDHTATVLSSGLVLIAGGRRAGATYLRETELFDPSTKTWSSAGLMVRAHGEHVAALLSGDRVLVAGGRLMDVYGVLQTLADAEIFDPTTKTWKSTNSPMTSTRTGFFATALPGDRVLLVGGGNATTDLFTLTDARFRAFAPLTASRADHAGAKLANGDLLVSGGTALSSAEMLSLGQPGDACTDGVTQCLSGFCVDGVCCDAACDGQCEACDVVGKKGTCSPASGKPHGARTACSDGAGDVCKARFCDGLDRKACIAFADTQTTCAPAACIDGAAKAEARCDGTGSCPAQTSSACAPYACGLAGCKTSCVVDSECTGDHVCDRNIGRCVVAESTCSEDGLSAQPLDRSQPPKSCAPFRCNEDNGKCQLSCATSDVCAPGAVCDPTTRVCVTTAAPPEEDSGCAYGAVSARGGLLAVAALLLSISRRRLRR